MWNFWMSRNKKIRIAVSGSMFCCLLSLGFSFLPVHALAAAKSVTWYLDGQKIVREYEVTNGYLEVILPPSMVKDSLRIKPYPRQKIARIELMPVKPDKLSGREIEKLDERREELQDRLKALEVKEEIFRATAKSQGSKAPRRTRTNPEPLSSLKEGTDFAITRLEDVYRARRKIDKELKEVDKRRLLFSAQEKISGTLAKVWLDGKHGRIKVAFQISGKGWQPVYYFRLLPAGGNVALNARLPESGKGDDFFISISKISEAGDAVFRLPGNAADGEIIPSALRILSVERDNSSGGIKQLKLINELQNLLPPGSATVFWQEEFIGEVSFPGAKPGETITVNFMDPGAAAGSVNKQ
jgi:hypothetical protein